MPAGVAILHGLIVPLFILKSSAFRVVVETSPLHHYESAIVSWCHRLISPVDPSSAVILVAIIAATGVK
jgi:hypothetical protein